MHELILRIADAASYLLPFDCMEPLFMRRAFLGLLLIAPLAALSGVHVVNSRMAFFSDAIGHSAFAGAAIGLVLGISIDFTMPALALAIGLLIMWLKRESRLSSDTAIGIVFSAVVAFGLAVVSGSREAATSINMFLFGDILTIGDAEIVALALLLVAFLLFQFFTWNRMLNISVSPQIAAVHRIPLRAIQYVFAALLSLVVIFSVRAVGVLLVTAILIVPAASARNFVRTSKGVFWCSMLVSIVSCAAGLVLSAQESVRMPAGAAVVLCSCAIFLASFLFSLTKGRKAADTEQ